MLSFQRSNTVFLRVNKKNLNSSMYSGLILYATFITFQAYMKAYILNDKVRNYGKQQRGNGHG